MNADEYRQWALKCLLIARRTTDPEKKARLVDMAATWSLLAHKRGQQEPTVQQQQQVQPKEGKNLKRKAQRTS